MSISGLAIRVLSKSLQPYREPSSKHSEHLPSYLAYPPVSPPVSSLPPPAPISVPFSRSTLWPRRSRGEGETGCYRLSSPSPTPVLPHFSSLFLSLWLDSSGRCQFRIHDVSIDSDIAVQKVSFYQYLSLLPAFSNATDPHPKNSNLVLFVADGPWLNFNWQ